MNFKTTVQKQLVKNLGLLKRFCVLHPKSITLRGFQPLEAMKGTESSSFKTILILFNTTKYIGKEESSLTLLTCHRDDISTF